MKGETVTVTTRVQSGTDPGGDATYTTSTSSVDDVLVAPGSQSNAVDNIRPDGIEVALTLYFPRTFTGTLRGAIITVRGEDYKVIGDPIPYNGGLTPTRWNLVAECERGDG